MTNLWLRLVGTFTVYVHGRAHIGTEVGSRKARILLALLAVERGHLVPVDRIADVLWGDAPPQQPTDNVATLVSRLRAAFGREVVAGGRVGYRLGDGVSTDLSDAAALISRAQARLACGQPSLALDTARTALDLLGAGLHATCAGADALADYDSPWTRQARACQSTLVKRARHAAATAGLSIGDHSATIAAAAAAIAADALDEVAHRTLMHAYHATGEPARALLVYNGLRATLARELGIDPAPATRDIHVAILRQDDLATAQTLHGHSGGGVLRLGPRGGGVTHLDSGSARPLRVASERSRCSG